MYQDVFVPGTLFPSPRWVDHPTATDESTITLGPFVGRGNQRVSGPFDVDSGIAFKAPGHSSQGTAEGNGRIVGSLGPHPAISGCPVGA